MALVDLLLRLLSVQLRVEITLHAERVVQYAGDKESHD